MTIISVKRPGDGRKALIKDRFYKGNTRTKGCGKGNVHFFEKSHIPQEVRAVVLADISVICLYSYNIYCIA